MNWETIICFGDSITIGSRSYLGYPEYCGQYLSEKTNKNWNVINHAVAGFTVIDLVRSIDINFLNLKECKPEIATLLIGTNDLKSPTSIDIFRTAYELVVIKIQLIMGNNNIVLFEIPNLIDGVILPYKTDMNKMIGNYNEVIREITETKGLILSKMECNSNQFFDGVHLNEFGSKNWGLQLSNLIMKLRTN